MLNVHFLEEAQHLSAADLAILEQMKSTIDNQRDAIRSKNSEIESVKGDLEAVRVNLYRTTLNVVLLNACPSYTHLSPGQWSDLIGNNVSWFVHLERKRSLRKIARKQCFLVSPPTGHLARRQYFLVCPPLGNMAREQYFLVCPSSRNIAKNNVFWFVSLQER